MHIKRVISQNRRDMRVEFECEFCGHSYEGNAYDDDNFHAAVVPDMECPNCHKKADLATFTPREPKYPADLLV